MKRTLLASALALAFFSQSTASFASVTIGGSFTESINTGVAIGGYPLTLTYDSVRKATAGAPDPFAAVSVTRSFGQEWFSSFDRIIRLSQNSATVTASDGTQYSFSLGGGSYTPNDGNPHSMRAYSANGVEGVLFVNRVSGEQELYGYDGRIKQITAATGSVLTFTYNADNTLAQVSDENGRSLRFFYDLVTGRVNRIIDVNGNAISVAMTGDRLSSLTWQDGTTRSYQYDAAGYLTEKRNESNAVAQRVTYNANGYVQSTQDGDGPSAGTYLFAYPYVSSGGDAVYETTSTWEYVWDAVNRVWLAGPSNSRTRLASGNPEVTVSMLIDSVSVPQSVLGVEKIGVIPSLATAGLPDALNGFSAIKAANQPAGSGCAAASSSTTYDANSQINSQTNFNGEKTCMTRDPDTGNLLVAVSGLASATDCATVLPNNSALPAGARKVSSEFMSASGFTRFNIKTAGPLAKISRVYNGNPNDSSSFMWCAPQTAKMPNNSALPLLCRETAEVTTDANGSQGLNPAADTRFGASITSYTYDAKGRLLANTNPNGVATSFAYYDTDDFVETVGGTPTEPTYSYTGTHRVGDLMSATTAKPGYTLSSSTPAAILGDKLVLNFDGADGSTIFTDTSAYHRGITVNSGTPSVSTAQSKFGGSSLYFPYTNPGSLRSAASSDFVLDGDFTIEFWANKTGNGTSNYDYVLATGSDNYSSGGWYVALYNGTQGFAFGNQWGYVVAYTPTTVTDGAWHHYAVSRSGSNVKLFVDGAVVASSTNTDIHPASHPLKIGELTNAMNIGRYFGYLDDIRISKGVARYTSAFAVPTSALAGVDQGQSQVIQFTKYDSSGRLLESIDPKGIVTTMAYTPRGLISSVTVTPPGLSARTTAYVYDAQGQVTSINAANGSSVSYTYLSTGKVSRITDTFGNSIEYSYDPKGNQISEQVKDPQGVLRRTTATSFDALNRAQQITVTPSGV